MSPTECSDVTVCVKESLYTGSTGRSGQLVRLYAAVFKRLPDSGGYDYWMSGGLGTGEMADLFTDSDEFRLRYGQLNDEAFIDRIYLNVLNRTADAGGRTYWLDVLETKSRRDVVLGFSESTEFMTRTGTQ